MIVFFFVKIKAIASICPNMTVVDTHNHGAPDFENKTVKPDVCLYNEKKYKQQKDGVHNIKGFERTSRAASDTLGQISLYAAAHQAAQYRTHVFSALVFRNYIALLYWDRSGLVATEEIQWDSVVLPSFFFRLNHATDEERGIDTTINTNPILKYGFQTTVLKALGRSTKNDRDSLLEISINHNKYLAFEPEIYARTSSPIGRATRTFGQSIASQMARLSS
ncbi:hypothetical protein Hypma_006114 [Hypsizygus marmoreus]|uniref:Fungal-type protein kinase domain-containing protein n=1 Tax=Hypsizygus marmoreus TaxID=39966 RepID=A0A369JZF2_HYPMA|nr:hypothetical protein Hypma_006114 [Hypsizygus marmoreus]